jgi:hypothetical protein
MDKLIKDPDGIEEGVGETNQTRHTGLVARPHHLHGRIWQVETLEESED